MIQLEHEGVRLCDGLSRRELLRVGGLGPMGLSLAGLLAGRSASAATQAGSFGKAKGCIQIFLWGGPGGQETWDLKPDAPSETRGDFTSIETSVPGFRICQHMPKLAERAHRYSIIRSLSHTGTNHGTSSYHMLTGHIHRDPGTLRRPTRADVPTLGANAARFLQHPAYLPAAVAIPDPIWDGGVTEVPGQRAGFLGDRHEPFRVTGDLTKRDFRPDVLRLPEGVGGERLRRRASLRQAVEQRGEFLGQQEAAQGVDAFYDRALTLLSSSETYRAFDLASEPDKTRDRYGWHWFGQSLALARRLIENGVPLVTVYWNTPALTDDESWDTHGEQHRRLKDTILPPFDRGLSALLDDLHERGLLDQTLVTWYGEFGRTPKINKGGGRDHWGFCQSIGMAGGGIRPGIVHGSSSADGGYPNSDPVSPDDLASTIYHCLGINHHTEMVDHEGRPGPLSYGQVVKALT